MGGSDIVIAVLIAHFIMWVLGGIYVFVAGLYHEFAGTEPLLFQEALDREKREHEMLNKLNALTERVEYLINHGEGERIDEVT
jgi:hypothetical protein